MSGKPQALVLDFGGVVTKTLFETHAVTEQALGLKQQRGRHRRRGERAQPIHQTAPQQHEGQEPLLGHALLVRRPV